MSKNVSDNGGDRRAVEALVGYVLQQLRAMFPGDDDQVAGVVPHVKAAMAETAAVVRCLKEWRERGFDKLISWQYATFLYKLGRACLEAGVSVQATDRLFLLNKALHGLDLHPQIELPRTFFLSHTNAAVFARATYSEYSVFHHGITVGRKGGKRPTLGKYLVMYPSAMIIGECLVRENTVLAPGVRLIDTDTPGNCYVFEDGKGGVRFRDVDDIHASRFFHIDGES